MDEFEKFYNSALRFLSYRPRSEQEIRDKLRKFKIKKTATTETQNKDETQKLSAIIDRVIVKLKEQKFINDEEFTRWWIEQRTNVQPRSIRLIKIELRRKGISEEIIDNLPLTIDDLKNAKKLIEKKLPRYKGLSKQEIYQKLGSFLARRGFDWETIKHGVDEVVKKGV
ncbi:MAG: regulatory protein RecX [Candidatus Levybacteria bacterium]|nr:regulatory protein RecX [Candidatus Levybacteria bacterium]